MTWKIVNTGIALAAVIALLFYGELSLVNLILIIDSVLIICIVNHYAIDKMASGSRHTHNQMTFGFIVLFWVAYTAKMPVALFFPDLFWVVPDLVNSHDFKKHLPFSFFIASVGYTTMMVSIIHARSFGELHWKIGYFRPRIFTMLFLSAFALITKFLLKEYFNLGVPTVDPVYLGIPMLTGFVTIVIDLGYLILVNFLLFSVFYTARGWLVALGLFFAFGNAGIDLLFGSKDTIIYQIVLTMAYIYIFRKFGPQERSESINKCLTFAMTVTIALGLFVVVFYKYFNMFRYARFTRELDIGKAIETVFIDQDSVFFASIIGIWNRISGIEVLSAVVYREDFFSKSFGLLEIVSGTITSEFTYMIVGTHEINVKFGVTQFGYFYIAGGILGLIVGCFVLARAFIFLQNMVTTLLVDYHAKIAFLPILWILMTKVLLGGGNLILVGKEFFVVMITFWLLARILFGIPRSSPGRLEGHPLRDPS